MPSNSDLFAAAFGDGRRVEENTGRAEGIKYSLKDRETAFLNAFGQEKRPEAPTPHLGTTFRWDMAKIGKLSFDEKMLLDQYTGTSYRDLPAWIIDGGYAVPSDGEKKYQRDMKRETGLTQSERNLIFNAAQADAEALVAMTQSDVLKDSRVLDGEIERLTERYGDELTAMLVEVDQEAAAYVHARKQVKAAEAKQAQAEADEAASKEKVREEIQKAQRDIELMNASSAADLLAADAVARNSEGLG